MLMEVFFFFHLRAEWITNLAEGYERPFWPQREKKNMVLFGVGGIERKGVKILPLNVLQHQGWSLETVSQNCVASIVSVV